MSDEITNLSNRLTGAALASLGVDTQTPFPNALAGLMGMPLVRDLWFNAKVVQLDGYKFIGCRFDSCRLMVNSPNFELHNCHIDEHTVVQWGPQLLKVIKLFNLRNQLVAHTYPQFAPLRNPDGTISIFG